MKNREELGMRFLQSKMASLRTVPERLLRPAARSVSAGGRAFLSPSMSLGKPRMYRAALCKDLGKPLVVQEVPATENLKSTQVCFKITFECTIDVQNNELFLVGYLVSPATSASKKSEFSLISTPPPQMSRFKLMC